MDRYLGMSKGKHAAEMTILKIMAASRYKRYKNENLREQVLKDLKK